MESQRSCQLGVSNRMHQTRVLPERPVALAQRQMQRPRLPYCMPVAQFPQLLLLLLLPMSSVWLRSLDGRRLMFLD